VRKEWAKVPVPGGVERIGVQGPSLGPPLPGSCHYFAVQDQGDVEPYMLLGVRWTADALELESVSKGPARTVVRRPGRARLLHRLRTRRTADRVRRGAKARDVARRRALGERLLDRWRSDGRRTNASTASLRCSVAGHSCCGARSRPVSAFSSAIASHVPVRHIDKPGIPGIPFRQDSLLVRTPRA
jgi:hypothetical protein